MENVPPLSHSTNIPTSYLPVTKATTFFPPRTPPSPQQQQQSTLAASVETLGQVATLVEGTPYLVWVQRTPGTTRSFASFFCVSTGKITTKRLSPTWISPPGCEGDEEARLAFYRENIATVLVKARPSALSEATPRRPPKRAPPSCDDSFEGSTEMNSMTSSNASYIESSNSPVKRNKTDLLALEMMKADVEEARKRANDRIEEVESALIASEAIMARQSNELKLARSRGDELAKALFDLQQAEQAEKAELRRRLKEQTEETAKQESIVRELKAYVAELMEEKGR